MEPGRKVAISRVPLATGLACVYGVIGYILALAWEYETGLILLSLIFGIPAAASSLAILVLDAGGSRRFLKMSVALGVPTLLIILSILLFNETTVCILMGAPFIYAGSFFGILVANTLNNLVDKRTLGSIVALVPLLVLPIEGGVNFERMMTSVVSTIDIEAPADVVWSNTVEIRSIEDRERVWSFSHSIAGLPGPRDASLDGSGPGAVRNLTWDRGIQFQEVATSWETDKYLEWEFNFWEGSIPKEIERRIRLGSRYLNLTTGSYRLEPLSENKTRLVLTTNYWMATPVNLYASWWGDIFIGDFHNAVLHVIKARSEVQKE